MSANTNANMSAAQDILRTVEEFLTKVEQEAQSGLATIRIVKEGGAEAAAKEGGKPKDLAVAFLAALTFTAKCEALRKLSLEHAERLKAASDRMSTDRPTTI